MGSIEVERSRDGPQHVTESDMSTATYTTTEATRQPVRKDEEMVEGTKKDMPLSQSLHPPNPKKGNPRLAGNRTLTSSKSAKNEPLLPTNVEERGKPP